MSSDNSDQSYYDFDENDDSFDYSHNKSDSEWVNDDTSDELLDNDNEINNNAYQINEQKAQDYLNEAQRCVSYEQYDQAINYAKLSLQLNPRQPKAYDFLAQIFRKYKHDIPSALKLELPSGILGKDLQKLVRIFREIKQYFSDGKMLRTCASKIFQFSINDDQRSKFYQYLVQNNMFSQQNMQKIQKNFILNLQNPKYIYEASKNITNQHLLILIYTKINLSDMRYEFLYVDGFDQQQFLDTSLALYRNSDNKEKLNKEFTNLQFEQQIYCITYHIIETTYQNYDKSKYKQLLFNLIKAFLPKITQDLYIYLIFSVTALRLGQKYSDYFNYCQNILVITLRDLQSQQQIAYFKNKYLSLLTAYLNEMNTAGKSSEMQALMAFILQVIQSPRLLSLYAQTLLNVKQKTEATKYFVQALEQCNKEENLKDNKDIRLSFIKFLETQKRIDEKRQIGVILPGMKINFFSLENEDDKGDQNYSQATQTIEQLNNQKKLQEQTITVQITRSTILPTPVKDYISTIKISEIYTAKESNNEQTNMLNAKLCSSLVMRIQAAIIILNSGISLQHTIYNGSIIERQKVRFIMRMIHTPLQIVLMYYLLEQNKTSAKNMRMIKTTIAQAQSCRCGSIQCTANTNFTIERYDKSINVIHSAQQPDIVIECEDTHQRHNQYIISDSTIEMIQILDKLTLIRLIHIYLDNITGYLQEEGHCTKCIDASQLLTIFIVLTLHYRGFFQLSEQKVNELSQLQLQLAIKTGNNDLSYMPIARNCYKDLNNERNIFQLVKISLTSKELLNRCTKLLTRWYKSNKTKRHLKTALAILNIKKKNFSKHQLQMLEEEYQYYTQQRLYDESLILQLVDMTITCMNSRKYNKREQQIFYNKVIEYLSIYIENFNYTTGNYGRFVYNVATLLFNQLGMLNYSAFIFEKILNRNGTQFFEQQELFQINQQKLQSIDQEVKIRSAYNLQLIYQILGQYAEAQSVIDDFLNFQ